MTKYVKSLKSPSINWLLVGLIAIAGIGFWRNHELNQTPAPAPTIAPSQWQKVVNPQAIFSTAILLDRNKTFVYLPIRYEKKPQTTWLSFDSSSSAQLSQFLVVHPALINLNWNKLDQGTVHLYQKNKIYKSIDDFLSRPPEKSKLLADYAVLQISPFKQLSATELTEQSNLNDFDFVLTSLVPLQYKNGAYYYENIVDASSAIIKSNKMSWMIYVSEASATNPYYMGEIHIDYRR